MAIARGEITITELYDGDNFYRAWADTPDGSGSSFTTEESDRIYLGVYSGREEPTHYSQYKWSRIRGESAITAILSNDSHQVGTDENGNYGNYTGAKTTVAVFQGGEDDTSNWKVDKIEIEPSGAVTGEVIDTYTYKVVDLKTDEASVIFRLTHKKGEYSPLEKTFTLSKNKQGISGQHASSYFLSFNDTALKKFRETGTMEPAQLMMQGMSIKADQKPAPQSGYFKIYEQSEIALDRDQYEQAYVDKKLDEEELYVISEKNYPLVLTYTSKEPEESLTYEYTDLIDIMSIKVYWYRDADFEELIDVQTISITSDGEKGDPGENAPLIKLSGDTQVVKISEDGVKTPNSSFTVTGKSLNADIEKWEYAVNGGSFSTNLPAGVTRNNNIVTINPGAINFNTLSIQATGSGVSDTFTVAQMADGLNAYTVLLSNESHTFQADTQKAVASSATTDILAYRGTKRMPVSVQSVTGLPTKGMTHIVSNNGKDNVSITFNVTTLLTSPSGLVSINLEIDGQQITKEFSYALSFKGDTGDAGKDAISAVLTNESITFAANKDGLVQNYVGNTGNFLLMEGTVNKSAETKFSIVNQTNVSATINSYNGSYTISSMTKGTSVTTGQVTFRADYKGTTIDKTVTISKSIAGQTGAQGNPGAPGGKGDPGAPATSYWLTSSVDTITVKYNGDYDPKTITYYGHSKTGSNNTQNYAGRFIVQTSIDGVNFTETYRSLTNMNKVDFSVPEEVLFIKAKFYQAGGTTYLLDEQTTPILHSADGLKGVGLEDKDYQVGTEIYTEKADDSVVHVEVDGKSIGGGSGKNLITNDPNYWEIGSVNGSVDSGVNYHSAETLRSPYIELKKGSYTLSIPNNIGNYSVIDNWFHTYDSRKKGIGASGWSSELSRRIEVPEDGCFVRVLIRPNPRIEVSLSDVGSMFNIQIEEGSTTTDYELSAPTPDYPVEIHSLNDFDVVSSVGKENLLLSDNFNKVNYDNYQWSFLNLNDNDNLSLHYNSLIHHYYEEGDYTLSFEMKYAENYTSSTANIRLSRKVLSSPSFISIAYIGSNFNDKWKKVTYTFSLDEPSIIGLQLYSRTNKDVFVRNLKLERGSTPTYWSPSSAEILELDSNPLINKINLSLSEPLRSAGGAKDRLFRDSDGFWKIERNVGEYVADGTESWRHQSSFSDGHRYDMITSIPQSASGKYENILSTHFVADGRANNTDGVHNTWILSRNPRVAHFGVDSVDELVKWIKHHYDSGTPVTWLYELAESAIETLDQELQDKLNNLRSFQDSNYIYTVINEADDLPSHISKNLKPTLRATLKGGGYYARWKSAHDLEKTTEYIEQEIKRTQNTAWIRAGMRVGYSGFTQTNPNSVYICGLEYREGYRDMVLVDKPAEIYIRESNETALIPKQALSVSGIPAGITAYIVWDNTKKSLHLAYFESIMTETGVSKKRWRNISGETIIFTDSLFAIGEIEV